MNISSQMSKMFKNALFFVLLSSFLMSCGGETGTDAANATDSTATTTTTEESTTANATTAGTVDATGKITDAVVDQACGCFNGAKQADGTINVESMIACMGGKNKIEFVAELLGPDASDKERSDAEKALTEKMAVKCPK